MHLHSQESIFTAQLWYKYLFILSPLYIQKFYNFIFVNFQKNDHNNTAFEIDEDEDHFHTESIDVVDTIASYNITIDVSALGKVPTPRDGVTDVILLFIFQIHSSL